MKRIKIILLICLFIFPFSFVGCAGISEKQGSGKKIIAVSIVPEATFVEKICGDKFEIVTMIPPGASPETYEPSAYEMQRLEEAEIYFSIGVPAEDTYILPSFNSKDKIVSLSEAAKKSYAELTDNGGRDPHIWLSPKRVKAMLPAITDALCEIDPENAEFYKENLIACTGELDDLDSEIKILLDKKRGGKFIALHPAFGYFADDYGLSMYALEEHGKEANAKHIAEMAQLAKKEGIKVIFYQAETSYKQAEVFAEEIGGKAVALEPLAADYTANLLKMARYLSEAVN